MADLHRSLKWRFSLWFGLLAVALAAGARYVHYRATVDLLARELDEQLWVRLGALDAERRLKAGGALTSADLTLADRAIPDLSDATDRRPSPYLGWVLPGEGAARRHGFVWFAAIWLPEGAPVASVGLPADIAWDPGLRAHVGRLWTTPDGRYRLAATAARDGCVVLAGTHLHPLHAASREAAWFHVASLAAVVPLGLLGGWLLLSWLLQPLDRITATAARIRAGRFDDRINLSGVDREIAVMAGTINAMLDRMADVRGRLEEFNGDLAHQVLGPVHGILLETDATLRRPRTAEELARALGDVRGLAARMESLCTSLLAYSSSVVVDSSALPTIDLEPVVDAAVERVSVEATAAGIVMDNRVESMAVRGNKDLLQEVFVNLLSNAVAHSPRGGTVTVSGTAGCGRSFVRVIDHGDGVDAAQVPLIFERGYTTRAEDIGLRQGHGVGLALCRSVLRNQGGDVTYEPTAGGGATFLVTLALPTGGELLPSTANRVS